MPGIHAYTMVEHEMERVQLEINNQKTAIWGKISAIGAIVAVVGGFSSVMFGVKGFALLMVVMTLIALYGFTVYLGYLYAESHDERLHKEFTPDNFILSATFVWTGRPYNHELSYYDNLREIKTCLETQYA